MRLVLRRAAKHDLLEARRWYDDRQPGLGTSFLTAIEAALATILQHPEIFPKVNPRGRRAKVSRFPYGIFYTVDRNTIRVIAFLHNARDPQRWKERDS